MEFLQWCWVFCYNHNRPLFLTCLTWTKFHPMGILLGFTKGKFFVDDFFSPGRSWVRWSKGLGNPGEKKPGKSWAIEIVRCFCIPFLSKPPKKNTGGCFFGYNHKTQNNFPPKLLPPPHFVARSYETSKQNLTKSTAIPRHSMYGTFTLHLK